MISNERIQTSMLETNLIVIKIFIVNNTPLPMSLLPYIYVISEEIVEDVDCTRHSLIIAWNQLPEKLPIW